MTYTDNYNNSNYTCQEYPSKQRRITMSVGVDSEFQDNQAITVQMAHRTPDGDVFQMFGHPSLDKQKLSILRRNGVDKFTSMFAPLDCWGFSNDDIEILIVDSMNRSFQKGFKYRFHVKVMIFWSAMDIRNLFADDQFYRKYVAGYLTRESRTRIDNGGSGTISLPILVRTADGLQRLVTMEVIDISSMQNKVGGLNASAANVGVEMASKDVISQSEKTEMLEVLETREQDFIEYAMGDVKFVDDDGIAKSLLHEIESRTRRYYSDIANSNGVSMQPSDVSLTVGSTVAMILTRFLKAKTGYDEFTAGDTSLSWDKLIGKGSPEGILDYSRLVKDKLLGTYGLMVDGGRAVSAVEQAVWAEDSVLTDIDIDGCYGNGLMNQLYAVGNPTIINQKMTLRECIKKYQKEFVPGLWSMRISTSQQLSFEQSVVLSKVEGGFTCWDNSGVDHMGSDRVADASMVLTRREIKHGLLNHDLLQVMKSVSSRNEFAELLDTCVVESLIFYPKACQVTELTESMFDNNPTTPKVDRRGNFKVVSNQNNWIAVPLVDFIKPLILERKKYPKKTPMNTFIKLIINTTYGVIASQYFNSGKRGCSNVVIGNNITARARALAYLMEVGLGTKMSITDGGVFDYNHVPHWKSQFLNLNNASQMYFGITGNKKNQFYTLKSLNGTQLTRHQIEVNNISVNEVVDIPAYEHLKKTFKGIDILDFDQYKFEAKCWVWKLVRRSKCDYLLHTSKGIQMALRGLPKGIQNSVGSQLFDAIETGNPTVVKFQKSQPYTPKQYRNDFERTQTYPTYLPDEFVTYDRKLFSHTPLGNHFETYADYERVIGEYDRLKSLEV